MQLRLTSLLPSHTAQFLHQSREDGQKSMGGSGRWAFVNLGQYHPQPCMTKPSSAARKSIRRARATRQATSSSNRRLRVAGLRDNKKLVD